MRSHYYYIALRFFSESFIHLFKLSPSITDKIQLNSFGRNDSYSQMFIGFHDFVKIYFQILFYSFPAYLSSALILFVLYCNTKYQIFRTFFIESTE